MKDMKKNVYDSCVIQEAINQNCFAVQAVKKHDYRTDIEYMSAFAMNLAIVNNSYIGRRLGKSPDIYFPHFYECQFSKN